MTEKLKLECKVYVEYAKTMDWLIMIEQVMIMERPLYFDRQIYLPAMAYDFTSPCLN